MNRYFLAASLLASLFLNACTGMNAGGGKKLTDEEWAAIPVAQLEQQSTAGDLRAEVELGLRYANGTDFAADPDKAYQLVRAAADKGNAVGEFFVGAAYANGLSVAKDDAQAILWFEKSAKQGYARAQYWLGVMIIGGRGGIAPSWDGAVATVDKAAHQELPEAQFLLGEMYSDGKGVDLDMNTSAFWYRRAMSHGYVPAAVNLRALIDQGFVTWQEGDPGETPTEITGKPGMEIIQTPAAPSPSP